MLRNVVTLSYMHFFSMKKKNKSVVMNLGCFLGQCVGREIQSLDLQNKYVNDERFRIHAKKNL